MGAKRILGLGGLALLAGCGREAQLTPQPGHSMPVKPAMARTTPTFQQLLTPSTQARPTRVDELVTRSKPRPDDPFDLPPPTGGAAAANSADNVTVSNPGE